MGLFDMFKSDAGTEMTPHFAFVTALIYMIAADGEIQNEEIGQLLSVLGGEKSSNGVIGVGAQNEKLLRNAQKYVQSNSPDKFLEEAAPLLTDAQKMCILLTSVILCCLMVMQTQQNSNCSTNLCRDLELPKNASSLILK